MWQSLLTEAVQLLVLAAMLCSLVRWGTRVVRPALRGDAFYAFPRRVDSPAPAQGKTVLRWMLIALALRLLQYGWGLFLIWRNGGASLSLGQSLQRFWVQWDAPHYLKLAQQGYVNEGNDRLMLVFFPMYPALVALLSLTGLPAFAGGLILSTLCTLGCVAALQLLVAPAYGRRTAQLACAYLLAHPFSVFLAAPYPEALFLCLTLFAFYFARRGRYLTAGVLGALSAFTRMLGLAVLGVILLEGYLSALERGGKRWYRQKTLWRCLAGALLVTLGFGAYLLLNVRVSGQAFTFLEYQRSNWSQTFGSLWNTVATTIHMVFSDAASGSNSLWGTWLPQALSIVWVMLLLWLRGGRLTLPHEAFSWVYLFLALSPTWLLSGSRYIMAMATLPILQAVAAKKTWPHTLSLTVQFGLQVLIFWAYGIARIIL